MSAGKTLGKTLGESLLDEIQRCSELVTVYDSIPTGAFGAMMIRQELHAAKDAISAGDLVAMLKAHERLKGCE